MPVSKKRASKKPPPPPPRRRKPKRLHLPPPHQYHPWRPETGPPEQCSPDYGHPGLAWPAMRRIANELRPKPGKTRINPGICPQCGREPPMQPGLYYKDPAVYETSHPEFIYVHAFDAHYAGGMTLTLRRPPGYQNL